MSSSNVHKYPKSSLHEFYQLFLGSPRFVVEPAGQGAGEPRFRCRLTCPGVSTPHASFAETEFVAEGRAKKASEHAASEKALHFIRGVGLLPMSQELPPPPPLTSSAVAPSEDELEQLKQRIAIINAQLEAQQAISRALMNVPEADKEAPEQEETNVDELPDDVVRSKLKKILQENKQLRADLRTNREHQVLAVKILQSTDVAPS